MLIFNFAFSKWFFNDCKNRDIEHIVTVVLKFDTLSFYELKNSYNVFEEGS